MKHMYFVWLCYRGQRDKKKEKAALASASSAAAQSAAQSANSTTTSDAHANAPEHPPVSEYRSLTCAQLLKLLVTMPCAASLPTAFIDAVHAVVDATPSTQANPTPVPCPPQPSPPESAPQPKKGVYQTFPFPYFLAIHEECVRVNMTLCQFERFAFYCNENVGLVCVNWEVFLTWHLYFQIYTHWLLTRGAHPLRPKTPTEEEEEGSVYLQAEERSAGACHSDNS